MPSLPGKTIRERNSGPELIELSVSRDSESFECPFPGLLISYVTFIICASVYSPIEAW